MIKRCLCILAILILAACSKSEELRFGDNPSQEIETHVKRLKKVPPDELALLNNYIVYAELNKAKGAPHPAAGKTIAEALQDARVWKAYQSTGAVEERRRLEEAKVQAAKVDAGRNLVLDRFSRLITVTFVKRTLMPADVEAKREDPVIFLDYDIENKGGKAVLALKGRGIFKDATGKVIVDHPFVMDKTVPSSGHITVTMNYRIAPVWRDMIAFTKTEDGKFLFTFEPEILILEGGEKLSMPAK
ncbi:MAG: hypothetical protein V4568_09615 [Pseudomonadota bacterium]